MQVAVFGLGYVGCVSAACLADPGHSVAGVDRDENKVHSIAAGSSPFYEPGIGPRIRLDSIYGTNRNFILKAIPHLGKRMLPALDDLLAWADCLVVARKPAPEVAEQIQAAQVPVIDLAGGLAVARPPVAL
jgi:hypothetical protein